MQKAFSNHEIVTLAVYLLGGEAQCLDTEDIAIKANEIAPNRFTWRKYPDQVNIFSISSALSDARKPKNGSYLLGSLQKGWLLTEQGLEFARKRIKELDEVDLSRKPQTAQERQWQRKERIRMLADAAFGKFNAGLVETITAQEAESFFRLDDYVVGKARERKVIRILNTFGDDPELGQVIKELASKVRKE